MTLAQFTQLWNLLASLGLGAIIGGIIVFLLLKSFVPSYLSEKAKNLATREDVAEITRKIEAVKTEYAAVVESIKATHQLRLAALDQRLKVHQQAFALWRKVVAHTYDDGIGAVVLECQEWWEQNCLFLEPAARDAFVSAYSAASTHQELVRGGLGQLEAIQASWKHIIDAGQTITKSVQLPGLTDIERKELQEVEARHGVHANSPR